MKKTIYILVILLTGVSSSFAQSNGVAKSLGVYVFPNNKQDAATQKKDEATCYQWAIDQTGYDPKNPPTVTANKVDSSPNGSAVIGSAKGAAAGAALGSIGGEVGNGAAAGAIIGGIRGRRQKKKADANQQQANNNAATAKSAEMKADYTKAFKTCLQAKKYTVN